jgi:PhoD-like phosphatase, N-terminal domain
MASIVSGNGVPSPDMMQATSIDEFEQSRAMGGYPIDEALKNQIDEHRRRTQAASQPLLASSFGGIPGFYHGVASGDPLPDAVIVWTRYTPLAANSEVTLELRMTPIVPNLAVASHLDPDLNPQLRRAKVVVTGANDWVAKIDVKGLPSGTNFIFAFADETGKISDVGQTKTAPPPNASVSQLIYAVFTCANFGNGYFHAYDIASTVKDLDFWVHVGDYHVRTVDIVPLLYLFGIPNLISLNSCLSTNMAPIPRTPPIPRNARHKFYQSGKPFLCKTTACVKPPTTVTWVYVTFGKRRFLPHAQKHGVPIFT